MDLWERQSAGKGSKHRARAPRSLFPGDGMVFANLRSHSVDPTLRFSWKISESPARGRMMSKQKLSQQPPVIPAGPAAASTAKKIIATTLLVGLAVASVVFLCNSPRQGLDNGQKVRGPTNDDAGLALFNELQEKAKKQTDATSDAKPQKIRENLRATNGEWPTLEPLLQEVLSYQAALSRTLSAGGQRVVASVTETSHALVSANPWAEMLQMALEDESVSLGEMEYILMAFREERDKAREKLRRALTLRQEALLVLIGILD